METTHIMYMKENFILGKTDKIPDETIEMHFHNMYEIFMLLSGGIDYTIEGELYKLMPGDIIITNPKEFHKPIYPELIPTMRQYIQFNKTYLLNMNEDHIDLYSCFENRRLGEFNHFSAAIIKENGIDRMINNICSEIEKPSANSKMLIKSYLMIVLCKLDKIFDYTKKNGNHRDLKNQKVSEILDYINLNLHNNITLDLLEKKLYLNRYYLCHIFKLKTGYTIMQYISYKRIMLAKSLLLDGLSPAVCSSKSGFNDYSNFFKAFKSLVGVSPKDFIRNKDKLVRKGEEINTDDIT